MRRSVLLAAGILSAVVGVLHPQSAEPGSQAQPCARLAEIIRTAALPAERITAWEGMKWCPDDFRVEVMSAAMRQHRRIERDEAMYAFYGAAAFRDGRLLTELISLATDRAASTPARVIGFMTLSVLKNPGYSPRYEGFVAGVDERGIPASVCSTRASHQMPSRDGRIPLPANAVDIIREASRQVFLDPTEPMPVRSAAACT